MIGYNGLEGSFFLLGSLDVFLAQKNETFNDGISLDSSTEYLTLICRLVLTDQAPELCANFLVNLYNMTDANPRERLIRLSYVMGKY